jgi:hypothetical protein
VRRRYQMRKFVVVPLRKLRDSKILVHIGNSSDEQTIRGNGPPKRIVHGTLGCTVYSQMFEGALPRDASLSLSAFGKHLTSRIDKLTAL